MDEKFLARFWAKVNKNGPVHPILGTNCWEWTGYRGSRMGYGRVGLRNPRRNEWTHRVSWRIAFGDIPARTSVLHKCDRGCCVNPEHLFLGNQADNMRDMQRKGRQGFGERHSQAKLTGRQVLEIRSRAYQGGETIAGLCREFGVEPATIRNIAKRKIWRHLP